MISALLGVALALSSCFTGIESTPKITDKEVRRQTVGVTSESRFADSLGHRTLDDLRRGDRFLVVNPKLSMLMEMEPAINAGDTIVYQRLSEKLSITGDTLAVLDFTDAANPERLLRYTSTMSASRLRKIAPFAIPFAVDLKMVEEVDSAMRGKSYYIQSRLRVDSVATPVVNGRRYVPVTILSVKPGNDMYPLVVEMVDDIGERSFALMTIGLERSATRNFDALFTFTDPRLRYPDILPEVWENIIIGKVAEGMTTDECRLSLGTPADVRKGQNGTSFFERWTFENGTYLLFEDGLLKSFRL